MEYVPWYLLQHGTCPRVSFSAWNMFKILYQFCSKCLNQLRKLAVEQGVSVNAYCLVLL